ncbi:MAG: hypothetical protein L0G63_04230 [Psychrobacter sp.]|uniref:hypothetical protein n=1 Tax=Psychrobacter sp. TaxID=56811 RepID=UPI002647FDF9|nr:hypothetical protein [Psychrobacter sp.]MDN5619684.1 hypothetical protein [Psychrobacter sp.]
MAARKHLAFRVEDDIYRLLRENAKTSGEKDFTSYLKSLIIRGLMADVEELYKNAVKNSETIYENALYIARDSEKKAKEEEYNLLLSKIDESRSYIDTQVNLMVNMCFSEGVDREKIERYSNDVDEENDVSTKAKFVNRLAVELARAKGYDGETIKGWVKKN